MRWTVLGRGPNNRWRQARWICQCKCGKKKNVDARSLLSGMSKSCGCRRGLKSSSKRCVDCGEAFPVRPCNRSRAMRCPTCRYQRTLEFAKESRKRCKERIRAYMRKWFKENASYVNAYQREKCRKLTDAFVRQRFKRSICIPGRLATPAMIEMKRQAILANRAVRKLWEVDKNGARFGFDAKGV